MKQAILVWSFRQNIFLGSLHQKSSVSTHDGAAVEPVLSHLMILHLTLDQVPIAPTIEPQKQEKVRGIPSLITVNLLQLQKPNMTKLSEQTVAK